MQSPKIDNRTAADLAAETAELVTRFTGWRPPAEGGDPGRALVGVFAHYAEHVVDRLNRLPEKNFLAFLNLIGAEPITPQPARVPLTFTLADGAPVDGVVPAGTQVAAPARQGDENEVTFETAQELLVTRARIVAALVYDPWRDTVADCLDAVQGATDEPFPVFGGGRPADHELYVACEPLLADAAGRSVRLDLRSRSRWQWETWPIRWSAWVGGAWQPLTTTGQYDQAGQRWQVTVASLPALEPTEVNGTTATWLRARLEQPMAPDRQGLTPADAGPTPAERPSPVTFPLSPFPSGAQEWLLDGGLVFGQAGSVAEVMIRLDTTGTIAPASPFGVDWHYLADGEVWKLLGQSTATSPGTAPFVDSTNGFTRNGIVSFRVPADWSWQDQASRRGRSAVCRSPTKTCSTGPARSRAGARASGWTRTRSRACRARRPENGWNNCASRRCAN